MIDFQMTVPLLFLLLAMPLEAADEPAAAKKIGEFDVHQHRYTGGTYKNEEFRYLLLRPLKEEAGRKYPLVVFLHGAGERGSDPAKLLPHFPTQMSKSEWREKYPCFLLIPQCRSGKLWMTHHWSEKQSKPLPDQPTDQMQMALEILDRSRKELPVDANRIYLTGLSMGGYGAWEMAMRRPELFAALAPVCGGGDESKAARLKGLPVWTAHGDADGAVPVERTRRMVAAIKKAGGKVRYTEYPGVGHNSWTRFYADKKGVVPWMFEQMRK